MDLNELQQALQKPSTVETPRSLLIPADKNNGTTTRRSRTREISSRYLSPTPVASSASRRCPSPTAARTASNVSVHKRAVSAERKRPSTPPSPRKPSTSTPVWETSTKMLVGSKKAVGSRMPESLWPSTMRSLSVSFQSDSFSLPINKRAKPVTHVLTDRTLRPSSNVAHKQSESAPASRKPTPERKRSPLKGKNSTDQSENSRPVEGVHSRLVEQHRFRSRAGGQVSSSKISSRSIDSVDKGSKIPSLIHSGSVVPSSRRWSLDGTTKPLLKSASDLLAMITSNEGGKQSSGDDSSLEEQKPTSSTLLDRTKLLNPVVRSQSLLVNGSRPASPNRVSLLSSSSVSRGASPSKTKTATNVPSRGPSPSRSRPSSPTRESSHPTSVLSFIADIKNGKKAANQIEDVHQLRLLYNRQLQWRYANARQDVALHSQQEQAELTLNDVWKTISELRDSVVQKRMELQQLMLKSKLHRVLKNQLAYLDEWSMIEGDHADSLSQANRDLQTSTLRLPVTGGAKGDVQTVKATICIAVDVVHALGSSIYYTLSQVEETNGLVSELADVASQERAMLDECEALLASTGAMQALEYSLRTNLIQMKEAWRNQQLIFGN